VAKYGRGLNREMVAMVNSGQIKEPFSISDVYRLIDLKEWNPSPTENYINCCLANGSSETHSTTYKKYFFATRDGKYTVREDYRNSAWL